jgi:hypothetical protein
LTVEPRGVVAGGSLSMSYYIVKIAITTALIVLISEISKRSTLLGAILASVPLVSVLAMLWLYAETRDTQQIASLAHDIFWLVLPSLALFLVLPWLLTRGHGFYLSLGVSLGVTIVCYYVTVALIRHPTP